MTQVKDKTDQQLNLALAELMGYTVDKRRPGRVLKGNMSSLPTDYCNDPAASLEVQAKALDLNTAAYIHHLDFRVIPSGCRDKWGYDEVKALLNASPRERAEAAYITMQGAQS
jgi:hypothetical protein